MPNIAGGPWCALGGAVQSPLAREHHGDGASVNDSELASDDPAALAAAVLDEEAKRQAEQARRDEVTILPDDLLPGVGDAPMSLKEAVRVGGPSMLVMMFLLHFVDELPRAIRVVAPDIQETFGISDTTLQGVLGFGGVALVLGAVPLAAAADHIKRTTIVPFASFFWAVTLFLTGAAANPFQMFWTNVGTGIGQAYRIPVSSSLLSDAYPIQARGRIFGFEALARPLGLLLGPLIIGGIATAAGGPEGWRTAIYVIAIPPVILGLLSFRLKEPDRGKWDQQAVLGSQLEHTGEELPVSTSAAFARLKKVKTFYSLCIGIGVLGFALIAIPLQFNLLLEDEYGKDALDRGVIEALLWVFALIAPLIAGSRFDKQFRISPPLVMRTAGFLVIAAGLLYIPGLRFDSLWMLVASLGLAQALISAAFVAAPIIVGAVSPYRIRAQAFALIPVFVFLMGGFIGGLLVGQLSDSYGSRTAMTAAAPPAAIIGGAIIVFGSRYIRRDISLAVEELLEEQAEIERMQADPDDTPVIQVHNLDFSYGPVQVLFDCSFEVRRGETLALLGTNGAGKSTVLRVISGLGTPDRGVVRLNGVTLTYAGAERRFREGVVQLRGGAGTFGELSVGQNLRSALLSSRLPKAEERARIDRAVQTFPALADRLDEPASELSGGQQQMLALAMALMHDPEVLIIDELSLGLAPLVVQELLAVIENLRAQGQTMIVVEQSLNVALAISDRAVFMEKGRVRFEGPAQELAERDDLARAVFLGGEKG